MEGFEKNNNLITDDIGPKTARAMQIIAEATTLLSKDLEGIIKSIYFNNASPFERLDTFSNTENSSAKKTVEAEQKAIRQLRHPKRIRSITEAFIACEDELWSYLSKGTGIVLEKDFKQAVYSLPGPIVLAIRCYADNIRTWLAKSGNEITKGWYRTLPYPSSLVKEKASWLDSIRKDLLLPIPFYSLSEIIEIDEELLKIAIILGDKITTLSGYVTEYPIKARTLRAVRLHQMLKDQQEKRVVSVDSLQEDYFRIYNDDPFNFLDAEITMKEAPRLFQRIGEYGWCGLGLTIMASSTKNDPANMENDDKTELHEKFSTVFYRKGRRKNTAKSLIIEIMQKETINRFYDIGLRWDELNNNNYSKVNIGAVLNDSSLFVHLAPSLYALREKWTASSSTIKTSDLLLTKRDCRLYVNSRHAGNPMHFYPLWTPAMEKKWCIWGKSHLDQKLFESLLFISNPQAWPASEKEKEIWMQHKRMYGRHYRLLRAPLLSNDKNVNKFINLFIVAKCVEWKRAGNWVMANRSLGCILSDKRIASILALLVGLDALKPCRYWQQQHECGSYLPDLISMLDHELYQTGKLQWGGKSGQIILSRLRDYSSERNLGWVNNNGLQLIPINLAGLIN